MAETVILDACCSLNLVATGRAGDILRQLPYRFCLSQRGRGETLYLRAPDGDERESVDLQPFFDDGLLTVEALAGTSEETLFVEFGAHVADGEAEAAALAVNRGYILATDDRKARRIVLERHTALRLIGTLELLHAWQEAAGPPDAIVSDALQRISVRATYRPRRTHPLWDWWNNLYEEQDHRRESELGR
jgi:hypothetical protein